MLAGRSTPFSVRLRAATRSDHSDVSDPLYMNALPDGRLSREEHAAALVGRVHPVYDVLEEAADRMRRDPIAGPVEDLGQQIELTV